MSGRSVADCYDLIMECQVTYECYHLEGASFLLCLMLAANAMLPCLQMSSAVLTSTSRRALQQVQEWLPLGL